MHERFLSCHAPVKREEELCESWCFDESWQARVGMKVFSTLLSRQTWTRVARELMRVDKRECTWQFSQLSCLVKRGQELHDKLITAIDKLEFAWEISYLSCPGQMKTRVAWELMIVDKLEFAWQISRLSSCSNKKQESRVAWQLTSESLHVSFLNSCVPVKPEQELHEVTARVAKAFLNSHPNLNQTAIRESLKSAVCPLLAPMQVNCTTISYAINIQLIVLFSGIHSQSWTNSTGCARERPRFAVSSSWRTCFLTLPQTRQGMLGTFLFCVSPSVSPINNP